MPWIGESPEDFRVEEVPLYDASGEGEHTFVQVEKRLRTSEEVARELAAAAGVRPRDVGYAGRKDRVAVARQWLSVPGLAPERARELAGEGFQVLQAIRHRHRLRTGDLRGNRFEIVVRGADAQLAERAAARLVGLERRGLSNRFGAQRFGRDGSNADQGRALLSGARPPRDRRAARFLLSALQAELFNAVLDERPLPLESVEVGDVARVEASGGLFLVEDLEREQARAERFEISATGPIFGRRMRAPAAAPALREEQARLRLGIPDDASLVVPRGLRLRGGRRPLRVRPSEASSEYGPPDALRLCFTLPPGVYATVLVAELCGAERRKPGDSPKGLAYPESRFHASGGTA